MPPPIKVELQPYDPQWVENTVAESKVLASGLGRILLAVHHVGSTAIPGIRAKPVLDLMPVVTSLTELDRRQTDLEMLGYDWWGEIGFAWATLLHESRSRDESQVNAASLLCRRFTRDHAASRIS